MCLKSIFSPPFFLSFFLTAFFFLFCFLCFLCFLCFSVFFFFSSTGGYADDPKATGKTLLTCNLFGIGAVMCAIPTAFVDSFIGAVALIWLVLFFGGALLPPLTGVCLTSVPENCRSIASSFSMFTYNILGYALAPVLMGAVADSYIDTSDLTCRVVNASAISLCASEIQGATRGFQVGMFTASLAWLATFGATVAQFRLASQGAKPECLACIPYSTGGDRQELPGDLDSTISSTITGDSSNCGRIRTMTSTFGDDKRRRATTIGDAMGLVSMSLTTHHYSSPIHTNDSSSDATSQRTTSESLDIVEQQRDSNSSNRKKKFESNLDEMTEEEEEEEPEEDSSTAL